MKTLKKLLVICMTLAMIAGMFPGSVFAENGSPEQNVLIRYMDGKGNVVYAKQAPSRDC